jgi:5-methylcytosine-specific restriction endonuclease McrA
VWQAIRLLVIERDGGKCVDCGELGVEVHHKTYRRLFKEKLEDLELLCSGCHLKPEKHPWKRERHEQVEQPKTRRNSRIRSKVAGGSRPNANVAVSSRVS